MTNPPASINGSLTGGWAGCASISDLNGNLLFYTNGVVVYDKNHNVMANGLGLDGGLLQQDVVILKKPASNNLYYVLTISTPANSVTPTNQFVATPGLKYSIIDMSLAAGNGSVITKNVMLYSPVVGGLSFAKHCNGNDYWIIAHEYNTSNFLTFQLTSTGLQSTPLVQSIGMTPSSTIYENFIRVSPNNKMVAHSILTATNNAHSLLYFDNSTGVFLNQQIFSSSLNTGGVGFYASLEFSPDCSKLYGAINTSPFRIEQFDLCSGIQTTIQSSRTTFTCANVPLTLQLSPIGKIYLSKLGTTNSSFLGVINNPNFAGSACNFIELGQSVAPQIVNNQLPNFTTEFQFTSLPSFSFTSNSGACQAVQFMSPLSVGNTIGQCIVNTATLQNLQWDFGDPISGTTNFSSLASPSHTFTSVGSYTVKLILDFGCGYGSDTIRQVVQVTNSCFSISSQSISCASLGSATVTPPPTNIAYTYSWQPSAQTGSVATNLAPGQYTVLIYDPVINITHTLSQTFTSVIPLTGSLSNASSVSCNAASTGTAGVTNLQGGSGNQSYLWSNGLVSYTTAFTNSLSAGVWSVNVTDALTGCQINQSFFISQPPPLSPSLTISSPTICAGSSAILTSTNSGGTPGYTYTFVTGPTNFSSTVTESSSGNYVYTVQSTDANNCPSSATVALNVITLPGLSVPSVSICPTTQALFTATGASSYTWLPPSANGSVTASAASTTTNIFFTDNPLTNTQYTLIGSALGCTSSTTTSVFIYSSPVPIISSNSPKCEGSTAVLSVSGGTGAVWSGPAIFSATSLTASVSNLSVANAGVYSTTITSVEGCTASATSSFVVNPTPTISAVGSTVCTTQTMSLFASSFAGSGYQWFGANNFWSFLQNPTLANPTINRTGSYTVLVTAPTSCTNTAIAQVSVTSPPSPSVVLSSNSLCAQAFNGSPNTITLTPSGASTYTLYTPNLLGSSTPIAPSASLFATTPYSSTLASGIATLQGSNGVCVNTSTFNFTVIPNPTIGVNSYTPVICAGKNFTYTSNGASSYVWSATTPNYTTYSNGGVAVAHPSINAVFSVYGGSLGCNSALQSSSITVYPLPTVTLSALSSSICLNDKTNLSVTGTGTSFQWLPATGLNSYTTSNVICGTQVNQVYTVIASVNNCTAAATSSVHVWSLPTAIITSTTASVCLGDNFNLSGSGGVVYNWFGPSSVSVSGQSVSIKAWSPALAGTYTLVVSDENNCKNKTTTNISILSLPEGQFKNFKDEACAPYCATYNFEGFNSKNIQSTWYINQSTITANVFDYCFNQAGTYKLQGNLLDVNTTCKSNVSYLINVHPKPLADFSFVPKTPIENLDEVVFTNLSAGDGLLSYHWYFNDNKGFSTTSKNTSYLYAEPGDYRVALVTKNNFNCADTILNTIHVENDFALYVPNTFTPNEDNRNDVFLATVRSSKLFDLKIYDRWGQEIFHAKSPQDGWDGTFRGEACKQDTYTWVIELSTIGGERVVKTGTVLLLR